ncbi:hypothetical protein BU25DRAFT_181881 [Macroventuria anomochaeta]|uniref:Uncharacterized protein n=1 Tax=Macroventuria anomochaeta TaxID=301207 RepID=A0ACB6RMX9_9PLEO|nr:uncharacterized protein BU25DRAFT_181881 [Macroventuria anomochaeta]KAF2623295.1 hypothetical protein BU25DRAFT_181881 [Macroventuria anomochaeta]
MLSSTRNIYNQIFAAPGNLLLKKAQGEKRDKVEEECGKIDDMLLIEPRKRSHATFNHDHATSHPASWQSDAKEMSASVQTSSTDAVHLSLSTSTARADHTSFSKSSVATLNLEQLQQLSALVEDRIQIKKRYNNTPLRRIIARQVSGNAFQETSRPASDTFSQTDTLVNTEAQEIVREPLEVRRARFNSTPLRRILSRQVSTETKRDVSSSASLSKSYEPEPLEVRKARYNNTPLRRIVSRQASSEQAQSTETSDDRSNSPVSSRSYVPTPVPRSNTPLRRILSRQASVQTAPQKDDDSVFERADSVIDAESPVRSRRTASPAPHSPTISLNCDSRIRAYEEALWKKPTGQNASVHLNSESRIRAYEEALWAKTAPPRRSGAEEKDTQATTITVTEVAAEAKKPTRVVVDSKGSPLRRILQRQTSRDWRAPATVRVV